MRIVAGKFRGRKLIDSTHLKSLRPTTDANRESLFNILISAKFIKEIDFDLNECQVIDICCGSGAVALEALSRGAKSAILVDNSKAHLDLARQNVALLQVEKNCEFILADVKKNLPNIKMENLRKLIFIDPPYEENYAAIIENLIKSRWIDKNDLIVVEKGKDAALEFDDQSMRLLAVKQYGINSFYFLLV